MIVDASVLVTGLTVLGGLAAAATVITLVMVLAKMIRDSGAAEERRAAAEKDRAADAKAQSEQLDALAVQVAKLEKAVTPNGKDTQQIGDIAARLEEKVDGVGEALTELGDAFQQHLGESKEAHRNLYRELGKKADKP
jgi:hypothetical protein